MDERPEIVGLGHIMLYQQEVDVFVLSMFVRCCYVEPGAGFSRGSRGNRHDVTSLRQGV